MTQQSMQRLVSLNALVLGGNGAALFTENCTACHGMDRQQTRAPGTSDVAQLNRPNSMRAMRVTYGAGAPLLDKRAYKLE
ncbi:c-type cytochrome [Roseinatronobacter sp. S2]|uniref:c-type cytochrome n=1 Tax=Roseinatronobacter sp. S2 TaxID=3035471 RepID=UPI0024109F38|nr:c-type cytochrome [Roseinatronobacter sp. S2]WFE73576.1 c-type cytochrome [Roseinatronobacter sp. S2]